ncbi:hypothetical protein COCCADRAFT_40514 [Bipolaris zeicola 26-R-13]|uniref:FAD/NAD(P)-binding domain-containing protein n=1 Tax=Cochliobolus carbonum (strain 26-R-13) TaxID=930089 RepID=W6YD26_COCC2|nr:uncharacterized protein COCCADRAFT_40514 [Bipolaris zeicola 26-R-13]EUC29071.1 hypothetical protein COCCADRAFT_40514 [Bipolaris zeicola 26-R-13]
MDPSEVADDASFKEYDSLIAGAGFGGVYQLKILRDAGYSVKLVEQGSDYGGICAVPSYEISDPALWKEWTWKQRFPGSEELRDYFQNVAKVWDLRKDTEFNNFVSSAAWGDDDAKWALKTNTGMTYKVKFLLLNTGFAAKRYIPNWKGIKSFKGTFLHPSNWPHEEPDFRAKKVAVIGTGSTGIQLAQELSKVAGHLTGFSGFSFNFLPRSTFDDTPEQRLKTYEELWKQEDFKFWLAKYNDMLFTQEANREAYNFWRDKTRARIKEPKVADILAPMEQPYAFGCKRISLENDYIKMYEKPNVSLVDIRDKGTPIQEITETRIKTIDNEYEFDYIISTTGYEVTTGGLKQIDIRSSLGESLSEHWKDDTKTYLGMAVAGFPNMFFTYGPQAPTTLCNEPTWKTRESLIYLGRVPNYYHIIYETEASVYVDFDMS